MIIAGHENSGTCLTVIAKQAVAVHTQDVHGAAYAESRMAEYRPCTTA